MDFSSPVPVMQLQYSIIQYYFPFDAKWFEHHHWPSDLFRVIFLFMPNDLNAIIGHLTFQVIFLYMPNGLNTIIGHLTFLGSFSFLCQMVLIPSLAIWPFKVIFLFFAIRHLCHHWPSVLTWLYFLSLPNGTHTNIGYLTFHGHTSFLHHIKY